MTRHLHALGCMLLVAATGPGADPARGGEPDPQPGRADPGIEARVEALLASMTLDERIGQMTQVDLLALKDKADIARFAIGSVLSGGESDPPDITPAGWAAAHDECQSWAL